MRNENTPKYGLKKSSDKCFKIVITKYLKISYCEHPFNKFKIDTMKEIQITKKN